MAEEGKADTTLTDVNDNGDAGNDVVVKIGLVGDAQVRCFIFRFFSADCASPF